MKTETINLPATMEGGSMVRHQPTTAEILQAAVQGGITGENVSVVKEIIAMQREETALQNKAKFSRAFFALRQDIATMDFYADKAAKNGTQIAYTYCSEKELSSKLEPVLFRHGFAMLFGQRDDGAKTVAIITLMHQDGHSEDREYSVRSGNTNAMKDATAADTGATTSAWRHLIIKMFGIKSRISEMDDARNIGSGDKITKAKADEICGRVLKLKRSESDFLAWAGAKTYFEISVSRLHEIEAMLARAEAKAVKP